MNLLQFSRAAPVLLWLGLHASDVRGDGGVLRLRETHSPFVITIFTASEMAANRPAEISVMVQRQDSSEPVLDATVHLMFTAPASSLKEPAEQICGPADTAALEGASGSTFAPTPVAATRQQASNKLLYAALVKFDAIGDWKMEALIERGGESAKIACIIPVASPSGRFVMLLPYLVLPPLMIALFAVNHSLRRPT